MNTQQATIGQMNRSIAAFMELEKQYSGGFIPIAEVRYHASWDWLMPVWKKAGAIIFEIRGQLDDERYMDAHRIAKALMDACQKADLEVAFHRAHDAIVFIQWFRLNQQSPTP